MEHVTGILVSLIEKLLAPFGHAIKGALLAFVYKLSGFDLQRAEFALENRRLARERALSELDELEKAAAKVEELGPVIEHGPRVPAVTWAYQSAKHRLRDLDPALPGLCDASARALSTPPEWQKILQLARPALAKKRADAVRDQFE